MYSRPLDLWVRSSSSKSEMSVDSRGSADGELDFSSAMAFFGRRLVTWGCVSDLGFFNFVEVKVLGAAAAAVLPTRLADKCWCVLCGFKPARQKFGNQLRKAPPG